MKKTLDQVLDVLNNGSYNILDADWESEELQRENPLFLLRADDSADIDSFDCVSIHAESTNYVRGEAKIKPDWVQFTDDLQTGRIHFWDPNDNVFYNEEPRYDVTSSNIQKNLVTDKTLEQVLAELDRWKGSSLDIFSWDDNFDIIPNVFESDFKMNVPVSIYSHNEDVVVKANFPWLNTNNFENIYPNELNFKSVLSILPVRVNSKQVKASFINGEFKLEFPKEPKKEQQQRKSI